MKKYLRFLLQPLITRAFPRKLKHNFHTLTPFEMVVYFIFIRPFWSVNDRFFFEGSIKLLGQMYVAERKALYETIMTERPRHCFEIGTFTGGGSTYFLSAAFAKLGFGHLYTMENDTHLYTKAQHYYSQHLPDQNKHIKFIFDETPKAFNSFIPADNHIDCVFFDGAEAAEETLEQFNYFAQFLKKNSVIIFHDWNTEKTAAIKPLIANNPNWVMKIELAPPDSVGLAVFKHQ